MALNKEACLKNVDGPNYLVGIQNMNLNEFRTDCTAADFLDQVVYSLKQIYIFLFSISHSINIKEIYTTILDKIRGE